VSNTLPIIMSANIPTPPPPPEIAPTTYTAVAEAPSLSSRVMTNAAAVAAPVTAAAGAAAHALAESSHRGLEKIEQSVAVSSAAPPSVRMGAASAAIQHHNEVLRHSALKTEESEAAGLPTAAEKVSSAASTATSTITNAVAAIPSTVTNTVTAIPSSVNSAAGSVAASASYAAHGLAEKSLKAMESTEREVAISAAVPSNVRFAAASSALEHHAKAKEHELAKNESYDNSGLAAVGQAIKTGYDYVASSVASGASSVASGATSAYNTVMGTSIETGENAAASRQ